MAGCSRWLKEGERAFMYLNTVLCPECHANRPGIGHEIGEVLVAARCGEQAWQIEREESPELRSTEERLTTLKKQVRRALQETGDSEASLVCFYQPVSPEHEEWPGWRIEELPPPVRCTFDELPERAYDPSYGAPEGEPFIGFSDRYVYISLQYDGSEWIAPIPRNPDMVGVTIPWPVG